MISCFNHYNKSDNKIAFPLLKANPNDPLYLIASKFETRIANALNEAFGQIKNTATLRQLQDALETGGITRAVDFLGNMDDPLEQHILPELQSAVLESGRMAINMLPGNAITTPFGFSMVDPSVSTAIRQYGGQKIREIAEGTRQGIVQNIQANILAGKNPRAMAREIRDTVGLTARQSQAVANFERGLRELDTSVLSRALRDKRFDPTVVNAIRNQTPLSDDQIQGMVKRYREKYKKYRTETIARTESLTAVSMGEQMSIDQALKTGKVNPNVRRFWIATNDGRTRDVHRAVPDMNEQGVLLNEPFQTRLGPLMFPRDPQGQPGNVINCRCRVIYKMGKRSGPRPVTGTPKTKTAPPPIEKPKIRPEPKPKPTPKPTPAPAPTPRPAETVWNAEAIKENFAFKRVVDNSKKPRSDIIQEYGVELQRMEAEFPVMKQKVFGLRSNEPSVYLYDGDIPRYGKKVNGNYNFDGDVIKMTPKYHKNKKRGALAVGQNEFHVDSSITGTFRHEYGHYIHTRKLEEISPGASNRWQEIYSRMSQDELGKKVSRYGATNERELFAESFSAFTHKDYGIRRRLPKEIDEFMESVFGKRRNE